MNRELNKNRKVTTALTAVAFLFVLVFMKHYSVFAATDGILASTSTGDLTLSLSVPNLCKISGISDLSFGSYSGSGTAAQNDNVCVYTNNASGNYKVTAKGSGTALAFTLTNSVQIVPYTVRWNNISGTSGNIALTTNSQSGTLSGANTSSQNCAGGSNSNFQVLITQGSLMSVPAGTYSGILTLVIDPV